MRAPLLSWVLLVPPPLLLLLSAAASGSPSESRLLRDLLSGYNRRARPVLNHTDPVSVSMGVTVQEVDLHEALHEATLNIWVNLEWKDENLVWDPEDYEGIKDLRIPPDDLWMPDLLPYNMLPRPESSWLAKTNAVVNSDGSLLYVSPSALRVFCRRDYSKGALLEEFRCKAKFGSWTYNGFQLDLNTSSDTADLSSYLKSGDFWNLEGASLKKNKVYYSCCPEPYVDVTLEITMRRSGSLSAWPNLPVAVSLLTMLAAFLVPVNSPQKLTLPCLAVLAAGSAVLTEFGLVGTAEYRAHFMRVYHVYTYIAVAVLLWSVLVVVVGQPRACRLPACLRRLLTSCLACICCLSSPADPDRKEVCHEWTALAGLLDRLAFIVFLILILAGSAASWNN